LLKKALFLDRDGVINIEKSYLYKIEDFEFIDGIFELCRYFEKRVYLIFVITNQSGIAMGYYSENDFDTLTSWMVDRFLQNGIKISKVYHCPHHPELTGVCSCRKPNTLMLDKAKDEFDLDMKNSIIIGDKESDIEAGINAGLSTTYLFTNSKIDSKATKIISSLKEAYIC
jgi:D-glycero-D-manno-heptose 1,7-bisphosphate phosphatase